MSELDEQVKRTINKHVGEKVRRDGCWFHVFSIWTVLCLMSPYKLAAVLPALLAVREASDIGRFVRMVKQFALEAKEQVVKAQQAALRSKLH